MQFSTGCVQGKVLIKVQNLCFGSPVSHSQKHHRCIVGEVLQWCGPGCGQQGWSLWSYHRVEAFLYGILVFCLRKDYANFPANFHTATLLAACIQCTIFFLPLAPFPICSPPLMKVDEILTQCICPKDDSQTRCMREMEENSRCIKQVEKCYSSKSIVAQHCVILRAH